MFNVAVNDARVGLWYLGWSVQKNGAFTAITGTAYLVVLIDFGRRIIGLETRRL